MRGRVRIDRGRQLAISALVVCWLLALTASLRARDVLPARYSLDADLIQAIAQHREQIPLDESFRRTGRFYEVLGLASSPLAVAALSLALVGLALLLALGPVGAWRARLDAPVLILAATFLVLSIVYLSGYSKDVIALMVVVLCVVVSRTRVGLPAIVVLVVTYGVLFRSYWIAIAAVFVLLAFADRRYGLGGWRWLVVPLSLPVVATGYLVMAGESPAAIRGDINSSREATDVSTLITPVFESGGYVDDVLNILLIFVLLCVPLTLLAVGGIFYWGAFVMTTTITVTVIVVLRGSGLRAASADPTHRRVIRGARDCLLLLVAFVVIQALFEPDYGSATRHLTAMLPLAIAGAAWSRGGIYAGPERRHPTAPDEPSAPEPDDDSVWDDLAESDPAADLDDVASEPSTAPARVASWDPAVELTESDPDGDTDRDDLHDLEALDGVEADEERV
ncbi:hypothetical protein [Demequina sp. NBRC 110055]|uniref:hypothetical protein n=1 Tax=Demequina sp. NBRC 110055 TaxID=1570344 RepID=UPI001186B1B3|nr:hypothetical protein [Demequina sp. NBRC 110055]